MGSTEDAWGRGRYDEDQVAVTLTHRFEVGRYEVTQDEWTRDGLANPSSRDPKQVSTGDDLGPRHPVGTVTWFEAIAFANLRSERASRPSCFDLVGCSGEIGKGLVCTSVVVKASSIYECEGYRLPTEAEWEYAARAGTTTDYYGGDYHDHDAAGGLHAPDPVLGRIAWYLFNSDMVSHPVGLKEPNPWGLYDIAGNAYEWVFDWYESAGYGRGPLVDPVGVDHGKYRVVRGGCAWSGKTAYRSAARHYRLPNDRVPLTGLRLARTLRPGEPADPN